ncbi:MAG: hypothetical protein AAGJ35_02635 [Myxococcota bacterium]
MSKSSKSRQRLGLSQRSSGTSASSNSKMKALQEALQKQSRQVQVQVETEVEPATSRGPSSRRQEQAASRLAMRLQQKKQQSSVSQRSRSTLCFESLAYQSQTAASMLSRLEAIELMVSAQPFAQLTLHTLQVVLEDARQPVELKEKTLELLSEYATSLRHDALVSAMITCVWSRDIRLRKASISALQKHPDARAMGPIMGVLGTSDPELRRLAEQALSVISRALGPAPDMTQGDV